jgi:galactokinase
MNQTFDELRSAGARIYCAPGRVNLIGEHTDYNDGFVMPAAIDLYARIAIKPRRDRKLFIRSEDFSEDVEFELDDSDASARGHWSDYVRGVGVVLERAGYQLKGAEIAIQSDVPIGAGLSSSAAVEVATAYAMLENSELQIERVDLAKLCQRAENEFVGMRCGIMDQFISCLGQAGNALMLDCRSLDFRLLPLPEGVRLVICNTMVKHQLAAGEYNTRRAQCEAGVALLDAAFPGVRALRDVTQNELEHCIDDLEDLDVAIYKRCRHVVSENARVIQAAGALERGDLSSFGELMDESHRSLRDDYEVSCPELDTMVDLANQVEGVYGARMTGGGFGGSTINLVRADCVAEFKQVLMEGYERATGLAPEIYVCSTADGAREITAADHLRHGTI